MNWMRNEEPIQSMNDEFLNPTNSIGMRSALYVVKEEIDLCTVFYNTQQCWEFNSCT